MTITGKYKSYHLTVNTETLKTTSDLFGDWEFSGGEWLDLEKFTTFVNGGKVTFEPNEFGDLTINGVTSEKITFISEISDIVAGLLESLYEHLS